MYIYYIYRYIYYITLDLLHYILLHPIYIYIYIHVDR